MKKSAKTKGAKKAAKGGKAKAKVTAKAKPVVKKTAKPVAKKSAPAKKQMKASKAKSAPKKKAAPAKKVAPAKKKAPARAKAKVSPVKKLIKKATKAVSRVVKKSERAVKRVVKDVKRAGAKSAKVKVSPRPGRTSVKVERKEMLKDQQKRGAGREEVRAAAKGAKGNGRAPEVEQSPAPAPPKKAKFKADELRKLREALKQERERLIEDIRALDDQALEDRFDNGNTHQTHSITQDADSASDNMQVETALGIRSIEAEQLMQIDEAFRAIDRGDYGICSRCGETISIERLLVKPMAKYCVPCRKLLETGKA